MRFKIFLFFLLASCLNQAASASSETRHMAREIYQLHPYTFFCQTRIQEDFTIPVRACDMCPTHPEKIKWMRIIPSRRLAQGRACYEEKLCRNKSGKWFKGLTCCRQIDDDFVTMENNLHNLAPEHPRLKSLNDRYTPGNLSHSSITYLCDLHLHDKAKIMAPPEQSRGPIARTYLYYQQIYQLPLTPEEKALFTQWHYEHPPTPWEKMKNEEVYALQGNYNPWVLG